MTLMDLVRMTLMTLKAKPYFDIQFLDEEDVYIHRRCPIALIDFEQVETWAGTISANPSMTARQFEQEVLNLVKPVLPAVHSVRVRKGDKWLRPDQRVRPFLKALNFVEGEDAEPVAAETAPTALQVALRKGIRLSEFIGQLQEMQRQLDSDPEMLLASEDRMLPVPVKQLHEWNVNDRSYLLIK